MPPKAVNVPEPEQTKAVERTERSELKKRAPRSKQNGAPGSTASRAWGIGRAGEIRHAAKCRICNHPDRSAIEFDFLNWRNPADLARSYRLRDLSTIYRHAHATGLFARRRLNLRFALERIVERVGEVPVTASSVIRAARAIARINDVGEWVDPPARLIVTHQHSVSEDVASPSSSSRRPGGQGRVTGIPADDASAVLRTAPPPIFDDALLDEPLPSAAAAGEMPKIPGAPPEIILTLTPEFQEARNERNRAIEEDRLAKAAKDAAFLEQVHKESAAPAGDAGHSGSNNETVVPSSSSLPQAASRSSASSAHGPCQGTAELVPSAAEGAVPKEPGHSRSCLPEAAVPDSASSALTSSPSRDAIAARTEELVASPSSTLPEAAPDKPATAKQAPSRGTHAGSSASADPPFPFMPRVPLKWKARRHFLIANEPHSRGESNG